MLQYLTVVVVAVVVVVADMHIGMVHLTGD